MHLASSGLPEREPWVGVDWDADPDWEIPYAVEFLKRSSWSLIGCGRPFSACWLPLKLIADRLSTAHAGVFCEAIDCQVG